MSQQDLRIRVLYLLQRLKLSRTRFRTRYVVRNLDVELLTSLHRDEVDLLLVKLADISKNVISLMDADTVYALVSEWAKQYDEEFFTALKGNTALMLCNTGNAPAKVIKEFTAKEKKNPDARPILKAAYVEETVYVGRENLEFLSAIKSKNELIADLVALLQSPAKNVVSALQSGANTIHGVLKTLGERAE